ncbi:hypothetical protein AYI68_g5846 [Smittium mucronatum]|uniref:Uncharacterized protein n=1 Tax=Smittium mucronatum TaxID=133383 RepID=A0A1R0GT46_9FUNG|nr:hypothetical protein AYI68_g5846 [Smittium mucronatum]
MNEHNSTWASFAWGIFIDFWDWIPKHNEKNSLQYAALTFLVGKFYQAAGKILKLPRMREDVVFSTEHRFPCLFEENFNSSFPEADILDYWRSCFGVRLGQLFDLAQ